VAAAVRQLDEAGRASSQEAGRAVDSLREVAVLLESLQDALSRQGQEAHGLTAGAGSGKRRVGGSLKR